MNYTKRISSVAIMRYVFLPQSSQSFFAKNANIFLAKSLSRKENKLCGLATLRD
jgi:hypothetical protein